MSQTYVVENKVRIDFLDIFKLSKGFVITPGPQISVSGK